MRVLDMFNAAWDTAYGFARIRIKTATVVTFISLSAKAGEFKFLFVYKKFLNMYTKNRWNKNEMCLGDLKKEKTYYIVMPTNMWYMEKSLKLMKCEWGWRKKEKFCQNGHVFRNLEVTKSWNTWHLGTALNLLKLFLICSGPCFDYFLNSYMRLLFYEFIEHLCKIRYPSLSLFYFQSEKSSLIGPPENTREHVVAASRAMLNGDWKKCRDFIVNDKMNAKVYSNIFFLPKRLSICPVPLSYGSFLANVALFILEELSRVDCSHTYLFQ